MIQLTDHQADWLTDYLTPWHRYNSGYELYFFTIQHRFFSKCAFSPTTAAPMLRSWFYQNLPLFSIPLCKWRYSVVFMADLVISLIAEVFNLLSYCLKHSTEGKTTLKSSVISILLSFYCGSSIVVACFHAWKKDYSCYYIYKMLCNRASMCEYKLYWCRIYLVKRHGYY